MSRFEQDIIVDGTIPLGLRSLPRKVHLILVAGRFILAMEVRNPQDGGAKVGRDVVRSEDSP